MKGTWFKFFKRARISFKLINVQKKTVLNIKKEYLLRAEKKRREKENTGKTKINNLLNRDRK